MLSDKQHAFHWERSMTDLTIRVRQLIEKHQEFSKGMVLVFTDFENQMTV
jgi:hypothetical protein